jgi:hypothetical protein
MPKITFYRQSHGDTTAGSVTFRSSGGITIGTGSTAEECATLVEFTPKATSGISIGTLKLNGVEYELYYQPPTNSYQAGDGINISNDCISVTPATSTKIGGIKLTLDSSTLEIST